MSDNSDGSTHKRLGRLRGMIALALVAALIISAMLFTLDVPPLAPAR